MLDNFALHFIAETLKDLLKDHPASEPLHLNPRFGWSIPHHKYGLPELDYAVSEAA